MAGNSIECIREASQSACRVAFFGGSFDPPHLGHLAVARAARTALSLDTVLFAPVGAQPLKLGGASASFEDRAVMTRRAIAGETGFALSYLDMPREAGAPNYTIDTLHSFRAEYPPQSTLFCLMGADSFLALRSWHLADEIPFAASLIVASRPGQSLQDLQAALPAGLIIEPATDQDTTVEGIEVRGFEIVNPAGLRSPFYLLPGLYVEISASEIRQRIETQLQAKAGTEGLLPESVANYIRSRGLYR